MDGMDRCGACGRVGPYWEVVDGTCQKCETKNRSKGMTVDEMIALREKHDDEFLEFKKVKDRRSNRPDLHALLLLDSLCPGDKDAISASEHDVAYLSFDVEKVAAAITEDQVVELMRCGVHIGDECFQLFT